MLNSQSHLRFGAANGSGGWRESEQRKLEIVRCVHLAFAEVRRLLFQGSTRRHAIHLPRQKSEGALAGLQVDRNFRHLAEYRRAERVGIDLICTATQVTQSLLLKFPSQRLHAVQQA